jgi:hypothetical protein
VVEVGGSHSAGDSEKELLHALRLSAQAGSSDHGSTTTARHEGLSTVVFLVDQVSVGGDRSHAHSEETSEHVVSELVDLKAVSEDVEAVLDVVDVLVLVGNPFVSDDSLSFDLAADKVLGGLHFGNDVVHLIVESLSVDRLVDGDLHCLGHSQKVVQSALGLFATGDLRSVGELVSLLLSVHVDEVSLAVFAKSFNNLPGIVPGDGNTEECHLFRPEYTHSKLFFKIIIN